MRMLRTLRLDASDALVFPRAAEPGEWAVPGGFAFWDDTPGHLTGKRLQAFRGGFLGLGSFGWSTLVEVAECDEAAREHALAAMAAHILAEYAAPDLAAARAAEAEMRLWLRRLVACLKTEFAELAEGPDAARA